MNPGDKQGEFIFITYEPSSDLRDSESVPLKDSIYQYFLDEVKPHVQEAFVAHHQNTYGTLPIWAAIEIWDFGLMSRLFAGMKFGDKEEISAIYNVADGKTFAQWLRSLNFIRNVSAHHSRLWNINVLEASPVPSDWPAGLNNTRPFLYFCLMQ